MLTTPTNKLLYNLAATLALIVVAFGCKGGGEMGESQQNRDVERPLGIAYCSDVTLCPNPLIDRWNLVKSRIQLKFPKEWLQNSITYGLLYYGPARLRSGEQRLITIEARTSEGSEGVELIIYQFGEQSDGLNKSLLSVIYFGNRLGNSFTWYNADSTPRIYYVADCIAVHALLNTVAPLKADVFSIGTGLVSPSDGSHITCLVSKLDKRWLLSFDLISENSISISLLPTASGGRQG